MNDDEMIYFEDMELGKNDRTHGRTITETENTLYSALVGSYHPMHANVESASEYYGERLVWSFLVIAIATRMHQRDTFEASGYGMENVRFTNPVVVGDTIHVEWEIIDKKVRSDDYGLVTIHADVVNQNDETVVVYDLIKLFQRSNSDQDMDADKLAN